MSDDARDPDPARCWQCGAPADPSCAIVQRLNSRPREHPDAFGEMVKRGRWQDTVWVSIPRCAACRSRNSVTAAIYVVAFFGGGMLGYLVFPTANGLSFVAGAIVGGIVAATAMLSWLARKDLNPIPAYPPLHRLLQRGWQTLD